VSLHLDHGAFELSPALDAGEAGSGVYPLHCGLAGVELLDSPSGGATHARTTHRLDQFAN
jgi:hypothetical protein